MKITIFIFLVTSLFSQTQFEPKVTAENEKAMQNEKIKCRWVCDKKIYKEQKIAEAISFYKNSKDYKFNKEGF
jgi:hypothetical protein